MGRLILIEVIECSDIYYTAKLILVKKTFSEFTELKKNHDKSKGGMITLILSIWPYIYPL